MRGMVQRFTYSGLHPRLQKPPPTVLRYRAGRPARSVARRRPRPRLSHRCTEDRVEVRRGVEVRVPRSVSVRELSPALLPATLRTNNYVLSADI